MNTLIITLVALSTSVAIAQHQNSLSRSINDDGKTLSIRIKGTVDDKPIDYDRTFDVSGLTRDERDALREHVLDSLHVSMPVPPKRPLGPRAALAPRAPRAPLPPVAPGHSESLTLMNSDQSVVSVTNGDNMAVAVGGKQPYTKEVNYNSESGQLHLRYRFRKDGDDFTYDRTLDVQNKSQQERQRIIDDIEKTIGVPTSSK